MLADSSDRANVNSEKYTLRSKLSFKCHHLCPIGERLRGEDRERRRGDGDLRLRGERLILRRGASLGLVSRDLSLPVPKSCRGRFL